MPKETKDRTTVNVELDTYENFSKIASLLGMPIKTAVDQALQEWGKRNSAAARKKANQLLEPA